MSRRHRGQPPLHILGQELEPSEVGGVCFYRQAIAEDTARCDQLARELRQRLVALAEAYEAALRQPGPWLGTVIRWEAP